MGLLAMFIRDLTSAAGRGFARLWRWTGWIVAAGPQLATHLLLAPLIGLLFLQSQSDAQRALAHALETIPKDPELSRQDLILVNPPDHTYTVGVIPFVRQVAGEAPARRMRALSVGASPVHVTRVDARTLDLTIEYGLFSTPISRYFRSADRPFSVGERFHVADLDVEIRALTAERGPETLRYRFAVPLEDPSLRWLSWQGRERVYASWSPPPVGESASFPPSRGIFDPDLD